MNDYDFTICVQFRYAPDPGQPFDPATCTVEELEAAMGDLTLIWPVEIVARGLPTIVPPDNIE